MEPVWRSGPRLVQWRSVNRDKRSSPSTVTGFIRWPSKPMLQVFQHRGFISESGKRDQPDSPIFRIPANPAGELEAVHLGHQKVDEHQVRLMKDHRSESPVTILDGHHASAQMLKQEPRDLAAVGIVFHDKHGHVSERHRRNLLLARLGAVRALFG